jgi:hypothetical protein
MHGADPKAFGRMEWVRSAEVLRLFVEFGYDIRETGHLIIQYVAGIVLVCVSHAD